MAPAPASVTLLGPESTGKSTLARALAAACGGVTSEEAARTYLAECLTRDPDASLTAADVAPIARRQIAGERGAEDAAAHGGRSLVVRDTDLVSTVVYARWYYGAAPAWVEHEARVRRASLYLLCDVDLAWGDDPVRDRAAAHAGARAALHDAFARTLDEFGCTWRPVGGAGGARLLNARAALGEHGIRCADAVAADGRA